MTELTAVADKRCTLPRCSEGNMYRMVGSCSNCDLDPVLMLFSAGHEKSSADCPRCGCYWTIRAYRMAADDEIPASASTEPAS